MKKALFYIDIFIILPLMLFACTIDKMVIDLPAPNGQGGYIARFAFNGNYLYTVNNYKLMPLHLSSYQHFYSCDPVVILGRSAYTTLSTGTAGHWENNHLRILDLEHFYTLSLLDHTT